MRHYQIHHFSREGEPARPTRINAPDIIAASAEAAQIPFLRYCDERLGPADFATLTDREGRIVLGRMGGA
jgi:hypothetical protein